jgi:hypothetical protein
LEIKCGELDECRALDVNGGVEIEIIQNQKTERLGLRCDANIRGKANTLDMPYKKNIQQQGEEINTFNMLLNRIETQGITE